jgi:hypothetical protein
MPKKLIIKGTHLGHMARNAHTVRLNAKMYEFLSGMSEETGIPLSTLVDRGLTLGIRVSAVLEVGDETPWTEQTMTGQPVELAVKQPAKKVPNWSGRVFAVSSETFPSIDEVVEQGIRRGKGEL